MLIRYLYGLLAESASVFFNILNVFLFGNLPPFGSVVVIVEDNGRFLVLKRGKEYTFPGGFMRWREHPTQTGRREVYEETGLHVKIGDLIGYHSADSTGIMRMSTLILVFRGEVIGGELRGSIEGQPLWVDEAEVQGKLVSHYTYLLEKYRAAREKMCSSEVS
jgi:8-oxo-dGTP diphosphatase